MVDEADVKDGESPTVETSVPLDSATAAEQMEAINAALSHYFESEEWLTARHKAFPGLRRD